MDSRQQRSPDKPVAGILIAFAAGAAMLAFGVDPFLTAAVVLVWAGSLFLATAKPPEVPAGNRSKPLTRDNIGELIENSFTPLLVTDRNKVAIANRTARKILGKHIVGQDLRVAFRHPEAIKLLSEERNGTAMIRGLVRRRDLWRISRQAVSDELGVIELINQTAESDISRAHTDFVANASHELRTPLASIIGYAETLSDDPGSVDEATRNRFLDRIKQEAARMQHLVSDLMSLSRVEAEKHDLPADTFDLSPTVARAARDSAGEERFGRVELLSDGDLRIRGEERQIEQLVRNLVDNALKYGDPTEKVTVSLERTPNDQVRLTVQDRGEGIAPEHLPHLTRRFYRTDPGRSRASGGTGLGLAIVKHIVERHRGRMEIDSKLGEGTSVIVRFPLAASGDRAAAPGK
ncbi:ATP-binding protein [Altererythrobacter arenosus]|uniref:histidine kinase n=1 Tax=Altererythrobacter arenosus TaxID=3032592 RepID=A0ABY8FUV5_9SPHN|nr:ATP-binding protein [Altererythrobacter sp. CAU 1644]WFL76926.1 ATP-binding protein [Altererythrobacter sp. CAU 1644]